MRPVTGRAAARLLASAEEHCLVFLGHEEQGLKIVCLLVSSVAKRLICAQATGAPRIFFTFFEINFIRAVLGNYTVCHGHLSVW